ncbi:patatin family protein [Paenibacillus sp. PAMC21692]|uniref:patatin-like phospholipase family protein n=1 Tax=Paenibacillus sp. PAMC21692 TaxID=2762320 RepID=UPI00164DBBE1|nr:patatin family protein [Paenibacillus sp. PAMC21692]QNK57211.1 patatin family protein [Paenibacillus sp. PAMC21692]
MSETIGLVLEGGGMRAVYTAGVLECLMEHDVYFPYNIGVSADACMGASYLSRQAGRNRVVNVDYVSDPRYISWGNLLKKREMFGMDFIFDEIPNRLVPFDYEAFRNSAERYVIGTTDCETGESVYYEKGEPGFDMLPLLRASSSLPFIARIVEFGGKKLLDGGLSDPIPLRKSEGDGNSRNVLILTRNESYRKSPNRMGWLARRAYGKYPELVETMLRRHDVYNETLAYIAEQERSGVAFVIRPSETLTVGRMERDPAKLGALYEQGYEDAKRLLPELRSWMGYV